MYMMVLQSRFLMIYLVRETDNKTFKLPAAGKNATAYDVRNRSSVDIMQSTLHCLIAAMRVIYFMNSRSAKRPVKTIQQALVYFVFG